MIVTTSMTQVRCSHLLWTFETHLQVWEFFKATSQSRRIAMALSLHPENHHGFVLHDRNGRQGNDLRGSGTGDHAGVHGLEYSSKAHERVFVLGICSSTPQQETQALFARAAGHLDDRSCIKCMLSGSTYSVKQGSSDQHSAVAFVLSSRVPHCS